MTASFTNDGSGNCTAAEQQHCQDQQGLSALTESHSLLGGTHTATSDDLDLEAPDVSAAPSTHRRTGSLMGTIVEGVEFLAEQAQEVATDWKEAAQEAAHEIRDAIVEEASDVKDTLVDDLTTYDEGDAILFDMGLTRNLSILPSDVEDVAKTPAQEQDLTKADPHTILPQVKDHFYCCPETIQDCCRPTQGNLMDSPPHPVKNKTAARDEECGELKPLVPKSAPTTLAPSSSTIPFHAYITLGAAVICLSSIGPSLNLQKGVESALKIYWRMTGTYMVLFPLALQSMWKKGMPQLTSTQWCTFCLAACCYATMCVCFVLALEFTSVGNVVIFSNSQSILLLLGKAFMGDPISWMESSGAFTAFVGAALCASDSSASTTAQQMAWAGWGDLLALLSAIGGVGYLVFAKTLREHVPSVFCFMFMIMFGGSFCVLAFLTLIGTEYTFDRDIHHGLWGFMNWENDRLPLEIWMVVICNIGGALGYVRAMAYFDNLIISVATLMEPVVASLMAYSLKVGLLPNAMGWVGNLLVVAGTVAVIYPGSQGKQASGGH